MKLDDLTPEEKAARIREQKRESYRRRYRDRKFRHAESDRKAAWLKTEEGKARNAAASARARAKR